MRWESVSEDSAPGRADAPIAVMPVAGAAAPRPARCGQHQDDRRRRRRDLPITCLLFAIGVAVGFAKDNNGVAGLRGRDRLPDRSRGDEGHQRQAQHGRAVGDRGEGVVAGLLYNRYKDIKLPSTSPAFEEETLRADCTGACGLSRARDCVFGYVRQPKVQGVIDTAGHWLTTAGASTAARSFVQVLSTGMLLA